MDRKKFLQTTIRVSIAAGLASVFGYSMFKNLTKSDCPEVVPCKKCAKFTDCTLQKAVNLRKDGEKQEIQTT